MRQIGRKLLAGMVCLAIMLSCFPGVNYVWAKETSTIIQGEGFEAKICVDSTWDNYCNISVIITNTGSEILENWMFRCEQPGEIVNIWNAQVVKHEEEQYLIKNVGWNQDIIIGNSIEFGYTLYTDELVLPTFTLGSSRLVSVEKGNYEVVFQVQSTWETGMCAEIILKNVGDSVIEDWMLEFDFNGNITELWNGEIVEHVDNHYVIKNPKYQQNLRVDERVQIGFLTNTSEAEADNFSLTEIEGLQTEKDEDQDGISDEYELKVLYPLLLLNGEGDSIEDVTNIIADEDYDNDGLSNYEEYILGTSSGNADSDGDGLPDKKEVEIYGTNPMNLDTDHDGLMDGTEIALGLSPFCKDTDNNGVMDGEERTENQQLLASAYSYLEKETLRATPDIYVTGAGDYTRQITVLVNPEDKTYADLPYLVSEVFEIRHASDMNYEKAKISFELSDEILCSNDVEELSIVRLDGAMVYPIKSVYDAGTKTISAEVNELCKYAVENRALREAEADIENIDVILEKGKADVVFVIDTTGSMSYGIANVQSNLTECAELLDEKNLDIRYGLVEYRDIYEDGIGSTIIHGWYEEVEEFRNAINDLEVTGGGDWAESAVDALNKAMEMEFRAGYQKYFMLVTDAGYKDGIASNPEYEMDDAISYLKEGDFCVSVVAANEEKDDYYDLYNETGGIFANIYSDFYENITPLIDQMEGEVHEEGYEWIRMSDYTAAVVATDLLTDSDGDGIPDQTEIGYILYTEYDEYGNEIEVYFYRSNPNKADSDGDGFSDLEDPYPMEFNTVITGCDEDGIVYFNTGKNFVVRFSEEYTIDEFIDDYRTRYLSFSKNQLEAIKWGLDITKRYDLSLDELTLMGYVDEGQMRYLMQDKGLKDKVDVIVAMTDAECIPEEGCFVIDDAGDEEVASFTTIDVINYFYLSSDAKTWIGYFGIALKQAVLGEFSDEANTVGTAAELGLAFTGLDIAMDLRDLGYDITHFEPTWEWAGDFFIDLVSLLPVVGLWGKSDRFVLLAKHSDKLFEVRRVVRAGEKIAELSEQVKISWKQLERSASAAYNSIKDKSVYNSFINVMDDLKQTGVRPRLAVENYNNVFIEAFADSGDVMKEMTDLPLTHTQKVFRETVMASTDGTGKIVKNADEIEDIAKAEVKVLREAIENTDLKIKNILSNKTLTNQTGKVDNYVSESKGDMAAKADFDAMNPINIRTYPNGTIVGDLLDGRTINIHSSTTITVPSLEIYDAITDTSIKIRY